MNDCNEDQTDEDALLRDDVSDKAIEAASVAWGGLPTLFARHLLLRLSFSADDPQPKCSARMRRGGSQPTLRSCRTWCGRRERAVPTIMRCEARADSGHVEA